MASVSIFNNDVNFPWSQVYKAMKLIVIKCERQTLPKRTVFNK